MFPDEERNVATSNYTFGQLLGALTAQNKEFIRQIEKTQQKLNNAEVAHAFNIVCQTENLLPGYTNIYIYTHTLAKEC